MATTKAKKKVNRGARLAEGLGVGRPKFKINYTLVKKYALIGCTHEEIAGMLDTSRETLEKDEQFRIVYNKHIQNMKMSLRRTQLKSALKGNVASQIWLGKQFLKQRDQPKEDEEGDGPPPVKVVIEFKDARREPVPDSTGIDDLLKGA